METPLQDLRYGARSFLRHAGLFVVALLASVVPALRALRVDPMIALRAD